MVFGKLARVLGAGDAAWLVAGNMIGAGIFITPGLVAGELPGLAWPLAAWVLGGLLALAGAAVYAELGARLPEAGGDYQYLAHAYGPFWGFLTGWAALAVTFSAAAAAMAIVVVRHAGMAFPRLAELPGAAQSGLAAALVLALTAANVAGARVAGRATLWMTAIPVVGLVALFGAGLVWGSAEVARPALPPREPGALPFALARAMVPVFFTYSGWNAAAYLAGEMREPARDLSRGLLWGTAFVTLFYVGMNVVLLFAVPAEVLAGSTTAGSEAARRLLGPSAERALAAAIAVAVCGSANVTLMAGARIYYAMAADGLAPRALVRTSAAGVPVAALWLGGLWTAALATLGRVEQLVDWATLAILLLSSLAVAALFVLRRRDPSPAAFRCPGYPLTPLVYLVACLAVAVASALHDWRQALYGLLIVAAPLPFYRNLRKLGHSSFR